MRNQLFMIFTTLLLLCASGASLAQTIYKCKAADGSTSFSTRACQDSPSEAVGHIDSSQRTLEEDAISSPYEPDMSGSYYATSPPHADESLGYDPVKLASLEAAAKRAKKQRSERYREKSDKLLSKRNTTRLNRNSPYWNYENVQPKLERKTKVEQEYERYLAHARSIDSRLDARHSYEEAERRVRADAMAAENRARAAENQAWIAENQARKEANRENREAMTNQEAVRHPRIGTDGRIYTPNGRDGYIDTTNSMPVRSHGPNQIITNEGEIRNTTGGN